MTLESPTLPAPATHVHSAEMFTATVLFCVIACLGEVSAPERVTLPQGTVWVSRPADIDPYAPLPLIFVLHGTETDANDLISFWRSLRSELPVVIVAPQASSRGWNDADLPLFRSAWRYTRERVAHDPDRVLLTGHSAGGVMALHALYHETDPPPSALAVTACYLPPTVSAADIRARSSVPVLFSVGKTDANISNWISGINTLKSGGVAVTALNPGIGHALDRPTTQKALRWFESLSAGRISKRIENTERTLKTTALDGLSIAAMEGIAFSPVAYAREHFASAKALTDAAAKRVAERLDEIAREVAADRYIQARRALVSLENQLEPSSLAKVVRQHRTELEQTPELREWLTLESLIEQENRSEELWRDALGAQRDGRPTEAVEICDRILKQYPESGRAAHARDLRTTLTHRNFR